MLLGWLQELGPALCGGDPNAANVLVEVQDQLQSISGSEVGKRCRGSGQADAGLDVSSGRDLLVIAGHGKQLLEDLICSQGETKLRGGTKDTGRATLEEGLETFFLPDGGGAMTEAGVSDFTLTGFHLQAGLDDIARRSEISSRHTSNGTGSQQLHNTKLVGLGFPEEVGLEMSVCREVDCGEGN